MSKFKDILKSAGLSNLKLSLPFLEMELTLNQADRDAAWELYIELSTRCATQSVDESSQDNREAITSLYTLFPITREILKKYKCDCINFSKIAIPVLNQVLRPFVSKWHKFDMEHRNDVSCDWGNFREELEAIQKTMKDYTKLLCELARVEDLS
ncbi:MAG: hypothetical protein Q4F95_08185 [Oscillospiraceae bacterium]|nr:hypothetical protein [Oscillospiraceae bacterium]